MKNYLLFFTLLISINSFGQFGFKAGPLLNKPIKESSVYNLTGESTVSYTAGIFYAFKLSEKIFLQTELNYSRRLFNSYSQRLPVIHRGILDIPLLLKYQSAKKVKPYVMAGIDVSSYLCLYAVGAAGINIPIGTNYMLFELRYSKEVKHPAGAEPKSNYLIALQTGFMF